MTSLVQDAPAVRLHTAGRTGYRTLLVHVQPEPAAAPRLQTAADLAHNLGATLFGLGAEMVPPLGAMDPTGLAQGAWYVEMRDQAQRNLEQARASFHAASSGLHTQWAAVHDMPAHAVARASREADLIVAGGMPLTEPDRYRSADSADLVLLSGRPVLIAPPAGGALRGEAVVVAWKDTRESRRAVADAIPLLARAAAVLVVEVCYRDEAKDAELRTRAVVKGLKRHDVPAQARVVIAPAERVSTELNIAADGIDADLIVAGCYGHSRTGEWVFGGVTRDLLHRPERFVLLSH